MRWNVLAGCPGAGAEVCRNCLAKTSWFERFAKETGGVKFKNPDEVRFLEARLMDPLRVGKPNDVEVAPLSDLFSGALTNKQLDQIFTVMKIANQHRFFVTTKFPDKAAAYIERIKRGRLAVRAPIKWPLHNVYLGVSVEDQASYQSRVAQLYQIDTGNRYLVFEPLLGAISNRRVILAHGDALDPFTGYVYETIGEDRHDEHPSRTLQFPALSWIIIGGALHQGGLPPHPKWVKDLIVPAESLNIPVWFKGWGRFALTTKPNRDEDETLVMMNTDGTTRGRGVGSKTNHLAAAIDGEPSVFFTRRAPPDQVDVLSGKTWRQRPGGNAGRTMPGMQTGELQALKQHIDGRKAR